MKFTLQQLAVGRLVVNHQYLTGAHERAKQPPPPKEQKSELYGDMGCPRTREIGREREMGPGGGGLRLRTRIRIRLRVRVKDKG